MSTASLGVHELMFNEQYFVKSHAFLTFTILIVPGLLASLIIIPINMLTFNISTITISKISYFIIAALCFFILTFFMSFLLREDPKNMGMHDEIVLKKIKTFSQWKIIILIMFGLTIYLIYYLMNSQFFNYRISNIDQRWHVYKTLFTTLPQVIGVFLLGWWLYYFFSANIALYFGFGIYIVSIMISLVTNNIYAVLISQILSNIAFGICSFVVYSLVLDWNYRQLMPITGIYASCIAILTCSVDLLDSFINYNLITLNNEIMFYIGNSIALLTVISLIFIMLFSSNYWVTEKHNVLMTK
ncbi:hypothetical protein [Spiroplasma endosymbiont of Melieria omissa]|uniref:hypothetical protein n=1 Tax=Spiroplasma endosymbiont of Melieria omissa TaxID=3139324 RepID=UPI003CCAB629